VNDKTTADVQESVKRCYSTWSERYYGEYYQSSAAYPPVHTGIMRDLIQQAMPAVVLDAGCGPASMLRDLLDLGPEFYGFDLTPEMVQVARDTFSKNNLPADRIWQGSVLDSAAYRHTESSRTNFDFALCFGVLPHIPQGEDATVLRNLTAAVAPGGRIAIEARNQLFALFTLNRYSRDFFRQTLIGETSLYDRTDADSRVALDTALQELDERFRTDLPAIRKGYESEPGYDEVLSRTHNPFELAALAREAGLVDVEILFYHFHALPPMFEGDMKVFFRQASLAMENPRDWRGHFMASAFILTGRKPA
jgi:2-polyprenyl-3-methyl-5-hydroxy-6-metoxy-1,4-benzoquinol methylase